MTTFLIILIAVTIVLMIITAIELIKMMRKFDGQKERVFEFDDIVAIEDTYSLIDVVTLKVPKVTYSKHVSDRSNLKPLTLPTIEIKEQYAELVDY